MVSARSALKNLVGDSMKTLKLEALQNHPEHIAPYKLCIAGVGFLRDGFYEFFSHYGDFIGKAPIYRIEPFVAYMKKNFGLKRDEYPRHRDDEVRPITFGWQNLIEFSIVEEWMEELREKPIVLN